MRVASAVPVQVIPTLPNGAVKILKHFFDITVPEWVVLSDCQRDDVTKYGLNPVHCSTAQRKHLHTLRDKSYVEFRLSTGKWELTDAGRFVVLFAPLLIQDVEMPRKMGKLLSFPSVSTEIPLDRTTV